MIARGNTLRVAAALVAPSLLLGIFFLYPLAGIVHRGLWGSPGNATSDVLEVLGRGRVHDVVIFTLGSAAAATLICVALAMPTAHVLYRTTFPRRWGRAVQSGLKGLVVLPFVLPAVVVGVAFKTLLGAGGPLASWELLATPVAIVSALVFYNVGLMVRTLGTAWATVDPRPAQAARSLGASPSRAFWTVTWPALLPALRSSMVVVFLFCSTAFGVVLILGELRFATLETEIYLLTTQYLDLTAAAVLGVLQLLLCLLLLVFYRQESRQAARLSSYARPLGRADLPQLVVLGLVTLLVLAPVTTLVLRSLREEQGWTLQRYAVLLSGAADSVAAQGLQQSLRVATDATVIALTAGLLVTWVLARPRDTPVGRLAGRLLDGVFLLPLGVSSVLIGFGILITLNADPVDFRAEPWIVPVAQALVALPLIIRIVLPAWAGIPRRAKDAARSLGAGSWRIFWTVEFSVLRRPILAATALSYAVCLGEFGATSFLSRPETQTLPVVIGQLLGRPGADNFGTAAAASVVLGVATVSIMAAVERLGAGGKR